MRKKIAMRGVLRSGAAAVLIFAGSVLLVYTMLAAHYAHLNEAGIALLAVGLAIPLLG